MNYETIKSQLKSPKTIGKIVFWLIITASILANIWQGWLNLKNNIYSQGFEAGRVNVNTMVVQQFLTTGKIGLTLPVNSAGKYDQNSTATVTIILVPQTNSTTTK